jgi:hypothetical protein
MSSVGEQGEPPTPLGEEEPAAAAERTKVAESQLYREQQAMEKLWEEHVASEFKSKSAEAAINTMVERPSVNHVPVMTGGVGRKQLTHFYDNYFIPQMPPDTQFLPDRGVEPRQLLRNNAPLNLPCSHEKPRRGTPILGAPHTANIGGSILVTPETSRAKRCTGSCEGNTRSPCDLYWPERRTGEQMAIPGSLSLLAQKHGSKRFKNRFAA